VVSTRAIPVAGLDEDAVLTGTLLQRRHPLSVDDLSNHHPTVIEGQLPHGGGPEPAQRVDADDPEENREHGDDDDGRQSGHQVAGPEDGAARTDGSGLRHPVSGTAG
jgi:hypothetical protein